MRLGYTGLGLIQGWLWAFFLNGPILYAVTQQPGNQAEKVFICFLLFNSLAYLFTAKASIHYSPLLKRRVLLAISGLLASTGPMLVGFFSSVPSSLPLPAIVIIAAATSGFGGAVLVIAWGELISHLQVKTAGLYFAGAVLLGTLLVFISGKLDNLPAVILLAFLPLLSLLLLFLESRSVDFSSVRPLPLTEPPTQKWRFPIPPKLVVMVILYYLASGFMYKLSWPFSGQEAYYLSNTVYCGVTFLAGLCIYYIREVDLRYLYRPVLPLLGAGFLLFPMVYSTVQHVSFILFQAGFALFDTYTWLLFVYLGSRHRYPALVVGSGFFLITFSIAVGELSTSLIIPSLSASPQDLHLVSLLAALLMFLATMVFQGQKETFAGWEAPFASPDLLSAEMETAAGMEVIESETSDSPLEPETPPQPAPADLGPAPSTLDPDTVSYHLDLFADREIVRDAEKQPDPIRLSGSYSYLEQVDHLTRSYGLTRRENEVLLMLLQGRNNPFIREQLNISNNTLKTHLRNLYNKLSVKNRQELLSMFVLIDGQPVAPSHVFPIH